MAKIAKRCKSSWLRAFSYDPDAQVLGVEFGAPLKGDESDKPGNHGHYLDVDGETFDAMNNAASPSAYLREKIIPAHAYRAGKHG